MAMVWRKEAVKLAAVMGGIAVFFATATPQTADVAKTYLARQGYSDIIVKGPTPCWGKGRRKFAFDARSQSGRYVVGELCMDSHAFNYTMKVAKD
ncbi:MAG: hypothetical protein ABL907_06055 [Hyphomicrobium sp.]